MDTPEINTQRLALRKQIALSEMQWYETIESRDTLIAQGNKESEKMTLVSLREHLDNPADGERMIRFGEPLLDQIAIYVVGTVMQVPCHVYISETDYISIVEISIEHDEKPHWNFSIFASNARDVGNFLRLYLYNI